MTFITYTARVLYDLCILYGPYSASNDLLSFPHINNSRPRYGESSKGPKTPTLPTTIHSGPDATHAETAYNLLILRMDTLLISPRIALDASSYPILASPMPVGPDTEQGCAYGKALSGRTLHHIMPYYASHRRTVLCHIDMCRITPSMPYHYIQSEKSKR